MTIKMFDKKAYMKRYRLEHKEEIKENKGVEMEKKNRAIITVRRLQWKKKRGVNKK